MPHITRKEIVVLSIDEAGGCRTNVFSHLGEVRPITRSSKRELIQAIRKVNCRSSKAQKSAHLDHLEPATGL